MNRSLKRWPSSNVNSLPNALQSVLFFFHKLQAEMPYFIGTVPVFPGSYVPLF